MVLVAGGEDSSFLLSASAELYDPASGTWTTTGSLNTARDVHTATLLPNGKVLIAGGFDSSFNALASAELYDSTTGTWTTTGSLNTARAQHTATLLPNGNVLVAGGIESNGIVFASSEVYDPVRGTWTNTGSLNDARFLHTATLLPNNMALVAGGDYLGGLRASSELYDPVSETWSFTGSLNTARVEHLATLLLNGKVLVAGGYNNDVLTSAELYTPGGGGAGNLNLLSAASRQTHRTGTFDIPLPLTGNPGVECRNVRSKTIVMTFNNNVTGADSASTGCGTITGISVDPSDAHNLLVSFNGPGCNAVVVPVTANNVHDDQGNTLASASANVGILVGDVTSDGHVKNGDVAAVQAVEGQRADASNFRSDVNLDGKINRADVKIVKSFREARDFRNEKV